MLSETERTKTSEPSPRQQRILKWMEGGNCIFEVIGKTDFTLYDDNADRDHRIRKEEIEDLERGGMICQVANPDGTRIDSWEMTVRGHASISRSKLSC